MNSILHPRSSILDAGRVAALAIALLVSGALSAASEPDDEKAAVEDETELQQAARKMAESVKVSALVDGTARDLELVLQPVLRFGDIPRANDKGSVWIWQREGRPQAIMELYRGADGRSWVHVVHSLSADALRADFGPGAPTWNPPAAGIKWNTLPDAPVPADRPAVRARQIKELAQKFTAHEFWDPNNSRYELRLLVQPVHKYTGAAANPVDGAVFLLCHETNPEVVLLIEAVQESDGGARYRYVLARLGHAELHVAFDKKEVWEQPRVANPTPRDAYFLVLKR
jgi:hypothetical protein